MSVTPQLVRERVTARDHVLNRCTQIDNVCHVFVPQIESGAVSARGGSRIDAGQRRLWVGRRYADTHPFGRVSREIDAALAGHPARGEGLAYRVAVELLPRYFIPPPMPERELRPHYNVQKPPLRRRA
jgi:hypothetical protein